MKLIFLYGPPAVGKLTIAQILAEKTGFKLLHNHLIVNPIAEVFTFDTPVTRVLTREFRLRLLEEAVKSDISMIVTFGIVSHEPFKHIADVITQVETNKGEICLVHLTADQNALLHRVENTSRAAHGKKLTTEKLKDILKANKDLFEKYPDKDHLTISTSKLSAQEACEKIIEYYTLAD